MDDKIVDEKGFKHYALVGTNEENIFDNEVEYIGCAPAGKKVIIDYHGLIKTGTKRVNIGDTVIFGFRTQTFGTRCANTAVVKGINDGRFILMGVYDHCCHRLQRWP